MTSTEAATTARNAEIAAIWEESPERVVTFSTGIVHVAVLGTPMCGTRQAARAAAPGTTPTCQKCGAIAR